MGEAKRKGTARQRLLEQHPRCIYCGEAATTTDHCPPRCIFIGRQWPETYEFAACKRCNEQARLDEQAIGVLVRPKLGEEQGQAAAEEWVRLLQGVANNQRALLDEWMPAGRDWNRRALRSAFGTDGDIMRRAGWGSLHYGELTRALIYRFMIKLGKALYYRHNNSVFEGVIYAQHISLLSRDSTPELIQGMLSGAPGLSNISRSNHSLTDQFIYRFNQSSEHGALYAVVQFNEQFIFQLIVLSWKAAAYLDEIARKTGQDISSLSRYEFRVG